MHAHRDVLAYVDWDPSSDRAVDVAAALAARDEAGLTVLHVAEPLLTTDATLEKVVREEQEARLRELGERVGATGVEARVLARAGRPFLEVIRQCLEGGHDLVVKAARGRRRLGPAVFGSTALHLLRKCPAPVWLVGETVPTSPQRILAVLGLEEGEADLDDRVLRHATALARSTGAELRVAAAWSAPGEGLLRGRVPDEEVGRYALGVQRDAEEALAHRLAPWREAVHSARVHLVKGLPQVELATLAARHRSDLVVLGTVPPGGVAGLFIKEEAEELVNRLEASVLALKPEGFVSPVAKAAG